MVLVPYFKSFNILGVKLNTFEFWGTLGLFFGSLFSLLATKYLGLFIPYVLLLILLSILVFYISGFFKNRVTGKNELIFYNQAFLIIIFHILILKILEVPINAYLDISILGLSIFLIFGRIGCFFSGCCHGNLCKNGVIYQLNHLGSGFSRNYLGLKLLPVQLIEAISVLFGVFVFILYRLSYGIEGLFLQSMLIWYFLIRYILEFFRGDSQRGYFFGNSYSQWLSISFAMVLIISSPPLTRWMNILYLSSSALMFTCLVCLTSLYFLTKKDLEKLYPEHLQELTYTFRHYQADMIYTTAKNMGLSFKVLYKDDRKKIILTFSNFQSKIFGNWISYFLAYFLFYQIGERPIKANQNKEVFQYINK